jgi:hypothetical protein
LGVLKEKIDQMWLGFIIGTIIPIIVLLVLYLESHIIDSFSEFILKLFKDRLLGSFLRIGLIGNLAIFLLTFNTGYDKLSRGNLMATIVYGLFIVYMFLW